MFQKGWMITAICSWSSLWKTTPCGAIPVANMFANVKLYAKLSNKKQGDTMQNEKKKSKVG